MGHINTIISKKLISALVAIIAIVAIGEGIALPQPAYAANPSTINFQGKVVNPDGTNVTNGTYSFSFRLYSGINPSTYDPNAASCTSDSNCKWEETQSSLSVTNGVFQVELGAGCSLTSGSCNNSSGGPIPSTWSNGSLYLTMKFNGDAAGYMTPLIHLQSVPFAFNADNLGGIAASGFIKNTTSAQSADFNVTGTGTVGTLQATNVTLAGMAGANAVLYAAPSTGIVTTAVTTTGSQCLISGAGGSGVPAWGSCSGGSVGFSSITTGTNAASLVIGTGGSLTTSGSGTITATDIACTDCVALTTETTGNYVASATTSILTGLTGGSSGSEGAALTLGLDYSQALSGDVGLATNAAVFGQSGLVFEGTTADNIETFIAVADPTGSDHTFTFPNVSSGNICISNIACIATSGTAGTFTGNYVTSVATSTGLSGGASASNGAVLTLSIDQTAALTWTNTETFNLGAGKSHVVAATAANTIDMVTISNSGFASTTDAKSALFITYGTSNAGGNAIRITPSFSTNVTATYDGIKIDAFTATRSAGTATANGIDIGNLTESGAVTSAALIIGTGWDVGLSLGSGGISSTSATDMVLTPGGNLLITDGDGTGATYSIRIGTSTDNMTFGSGFEPVLAGNARHTRKIGLTPEYPGAVMTADGSSNTGTMTSDYCGNDGAGAFPDVNTGVCASGEYHSYYTWVTTAQNDYDIWVKWQVPSDFSDFIASNPISMYGWRTDNTATTTVTLSLFNASGALCGSATNVATGTATWTTTNLGGTITASGCTIAAGDVVSFRIQMAANNKTVRAGELSVSYLSKW